jgi:lipooligosaccharide transport system ATP-binding protein
LARADQGHVTLLGLPLPRLAVEARAAVGVVAQADTLDPDFSVKENLYVFARYFGISRAVLDQRVPALLDFAALGKRQNDKVTALSGGLRRRLMLARALINEPDMIFLDEPTTALDPQARHLIWERLQALREQGKTLLLTTHFMDEAQRLCDRIAVLDDGRLIAVDTPRALIETYIGSDVIELFGRGAAAWAETRPELHEQTRIESSGETVFVYSPHARRWLQALDELPAIGRPAYLFRPANLEDVFIRLTGRDLRDA